MIRLAQPIMIGWVATLAIVREAVEPAENWRRNCASPVLIPVRVRKGLLPLGEEIALLLVWRQRWNRHHRRPVGATHGPRWPIVWQAADQKHRRDLPTRAVRIDEVSERFAI